MLSNLFVLQMSTRLKMNINGGARTHSPPARAVTTPSLSLTGDLFWT